MSKSININFDVTTQESFFIGVIEAYIKCAKTFMVAPDTAEAIATMETDPSHAVAPALALLIEEACDGDDERMAELLNLIVDGLLPDHKIAQGLAIKKDGVDAGFFEATPENVRALRADLEAAESEGRDHMRINGTKIPVSVARSMLEMIEKVKGVPPAPEPSAPTKH